MKKIISAILAVLILASSFIPAYADARIKGDIDGNGKVKFGFIEPEYKEYLKEMNKWYEEGLIEPEYAASNSATLDTKMISDIGGAFIGYSGSAMSKYMAAARVENPDYKLVAAQWPTTDGGAPYCGNPYQKGGTPGSGMAISKTNKNIEKSLEIIDYLLVLQRKYQKIEGLQSLL